MTKRTKKKTKQTKKPRKKQVIFYNNNENEIEGDMAGFSSTSGVLKKAFEKDGVTFFGSTVYTLEDEMSKLDLYVSAVPVKKKSQDVSEDVFGKSSKLLKAHKPPPGMEIAWKDYGAPHTLKDGFWEALWADILAHKKASGKEEIKVGVCCMGGNGRTGTILACLAFVSGASTDGPVKFIRSNYKESAVESKDQIEYVAKLSGIKEDVKPNYGGTTYGGSTSGSTGGGSSTYDYSYDYGKWNNGKFEFDKDKKTDKPKLESGTIKVTLQSPALKWLRNLFRLRTAALKEREEKLGKDGRTSAAVKTWGDRTDCEGVESLLSDLYEQTQKGTAKDPGPWKLVELPIEMKDARIITAYLSLLTRKLEAEGKTLDKKSSRFIEIEEQLRNVDYIADAFDEAENYVLKEIAKGMQAA